MSNVNGKRCGMAAQAPPNPSKRLQAEFPAPGNRNPNPSPTASGVKGMEVELLDEETLLKYKEDEEVLHLPQVASFLSKWKRPPLSPSYLSLSKGILFQQLEIDYVIGYTHESLFPTSPGPAAILRIFGATKEGHSVCCHVHGFEPYFYICCPSGMGPDDISKFHQTLEVRMRESNRSSNVPKFVKRVEMVQKKSIMYYKKNKIQPFLKIVVALPTMVASCRDILEGGIHLEGFGLKFFLTYKSNISFALCFMVDCEIVGENWIEVPAGKYKNATQSFSSCQLEFHCLYSELISHAPNGEYSKIAPYRILSFDIVCAGRKGLFPKASHDPVVQIANQVTHQGEKNPFTRNVMTLKSCSPIPEVDVMSFDTEKDLLLAWKDFIREIDPDIIIGLVPHHYICKFDLPYLIERAKVLKVAGFSKLGRVRNSRIQDQDSTSSLREHDLDITIVGRIQFDLYKAIYKDYHLISYQLNSVSTLFLGDQKDNVPYSIISDLQNGNSETRRRLAVYCLKDAYLSQRLLDKLKFIYKYVEMARDAGVSISHLLSDGPSFEVHSRFLRETERRNLIFPNDYGEATLRAIHDFVSSL